MNIKVKRVLIEFENGIVQTENFRATQLQSGELCSVIALPPFTEAKEVLEHFKKKSELLAVEHSIIMALRGFTDFECNPVNRLNYLQVLRKLVKLEKEISAGKCVWSCPEKRIGDIYNCKGDLVGKYWMDSNPPPDGTVCHVCGKIVVMKGGVE